VRKSTIYLFVLGLAVVVGTALASAGLVASAQNSNSATTTTNTTKPKTKHIQKAAPAMPRCDNTKQEQTDLSGTYTGKLKHGDGPTVDATLTVNGNNFTATMGRHSFGKDNRGHNLRLHGSDNDDGRRATGNVIAGQEGWRQLNANQRAGRAANGHLYHGRRRSDEGQAPAPET